MDGVQYGKFLSNPSPGEEVVITGLAGEYPCSKNVNEFCANLFEKKHLGTKNRWDGDHPNLPKKAANLDNLEKFDAGYFGTHYRQADNMDPLMRKCMETAVAAVIDAGLHPSELEETRTGVFIGTCFSDVEARTMMNITERQKFAVTGHLRCFIANRISYYLKLKGPSYIADTACSSSFNALENAFKAIRNGQCDNAIVGGVNICLHPIITIQFHQLGVLSLDGICKVFDENANGYVRSEASVCVLLQKAKNARRIYAKVLYAKINDDGFKNQGINFPSSHMQETLMREVLHETGISPSDLSYMEAHGTGTKVGDPEEVQAIDNAIAKRRQKPLRVGSVKCNIGHSEPASGLCSLSKVIFAMETGRIPPNINLRKIRSVLRGFNEGRMLVTTEETDLGDEEAIVGINNFGFGGNNCHVLLRRFHKAKIDKGVPEDDVPRLVCISGRTEDSVSTFINNLNIKHLDCEYVSLLHHVFKKNFESHPYRGYTILSKSGSIKSSQKLYQENLSFVVFFGKLDSSYKTIGRYLLDFPVFKQALFKINNYLSAKSVNVVDLIVKRHTESEYDLLGTIVVQIGIVELLKSLKLCPIAVYGESVGKLAAKYYYKTVTLEEALQTGYKCAKSNENNFNFENIVLELKPSITKRETRYFFPQNGTVNGVDYNKEDDFINNKNNYYIPKDATVLNISNTSLCNKNVVLIEDGTVKFLELLGSLYECGHNPQLYNLYPKINFPVSRGTPSISPFITWNHDKSWHIFKFTGYDDEESDHLEVKISSMYDECKYMTGHVIDGRNLIPATEYLRIAWELLARNHALAVEDTPVVFENCKFIRAVTLPSNSIVKLRVAYDKYTSKFQIFDGNSVIVNGYMSVPTDLNIQKLEFDCKEDYSELALKQDEIYRELYLRGYNYSGLFKGIIECNVEATNGVLRWENNWTSFIDTMLQIKILETDTRSLYVPVGIGKLVIDPTEHLRLTGKKKCDLPVYVKKGCGVVKSGGIEIHGLQAKAIAKRKSLLEPVLEKHQFIPNEGHVDLVTSIRINVQIILENTLDNKFKAVEINDVTAEMDPKFLLPLISQALEDVPLIKPDLIISSKENIEPITGIKHENYAFSLSSGLSLIVGNRLLQKSNLEPFLNALGQNGFILTREDLNFVLTNADNINVVTEYVTGKEKLILFRNATEIFKSKYIEITSDHFNWLPNLQNALKNEASVVVYSHNNQFDGIMGLVNCLRREPGGSKVKCLLIMDEAPEFNPNHLFYTPEIKKNLAINVYKNSKWGTYRHLLLDNLKEVESEHVCVNTTVKGDLSSLRWIQGPLTSMTQPKDGHILIHNYYSSLNFKDVMVASGRLDSDAFMLSRLEQECWLGFEFSGRDVNGKRVAGMTNQASLSTLLAADNAMVWSVPDYWSLEEAATVSVVYYTVMYGLLKVINLKAGASILIHSATGGVGLAALNVCLYYKCNVFATVGTQEKRFFLKEHYPQIPDSHIGNSRDNSFEEMIKIETKGRGVDIVLNSLTEEKLIASVRCLAQGGSFIEIGKYDLANNHLLNLLLLEKDITYHGVMMDRIDSPETKKWLVDKIEEGVKLGFVKPLPRTVFKQNEIENAFRYMTTGKHIGKVLVKIREEESQKILKPTRTVFKGVSRFNCDPDKSYIIIGGLGGLGLELTDWLILKGARKVVLVTSSGVKTGYQAQRIRIWKSYGIIVHVSQCDITTKEGCFSLIKEAEALGSVDGIFNLAVVLKDALFEDQTENNFKLSLAPKANSTIYLDEITRKLCPKLRHFVVFSSVSCGRGNAGQTNYGMANSIMERVCEKRKQDGLPALAIQWGAIGDVGLVAKMQKENRELVIGGTLQQKVSSCLAVLDTFLNQDSAVVSSMVVAEKTNKNLNSGSAVDVAAAILGIKNMKTISQHTTFAELGMDSMMGTEMIQVLEKNFEIYITPQEIRSLTFAKLTEIENEKKSEVKEIKENKSAQGTDLLLQFIPEYRSGESKLFELPSSVNDKAKASTVFVLSGMEGVFKPLERLTSNFKAKVFGIQYNYDHPEDSIEKTAKAIIPHMMKHIAKEKTFCIVAYSYGVSVALEIANILEKEGIVGTICAIDGSPTYSVAAIKQILPDQSEDEFQTALMLRIMSMVLSIEVLIKEKENFLKCKNLEDRINLGLSLIPPNAMKNNLEKQGAVSLYKRLKALLGYSFGHEKIKSNIHLFKAKFPMVINVDNDYGLSQFCKHPVQVHTVEGHHVSMLDQDELAESINNILLK